MSNNSKPMFERHGTHLLGRLTNYKNAAERYIVQADARIALLESEAAELRAELETCKRERDAGEEQRYRSVCTYCGHLSDRIEDAEERRNQIAFHIIDCDKHPAGVIFRKWEEEHARAESAEAKVTALKAAAPPTQEPK